MSGSIDSRLRHRFASDLRPPTVIGYALLFAMIFAPTSYSAIKIALLTVTLGGAALCFLHEGRLGLHPSVLVHTVMFSGVGLFFVLLGSLHGNPGAMAMAPVFAFWPLVYVLLIGGLEQRGHLERIIQVLVVATLAIDLYTYHFLLYRVGILPSSFYLPLKLGLAASDNLTEFNSYALASMIFLVPFLIGALFLWPKERAMPVRRGWLWLAIASALPLVLLSGRRGLWIAVGIAPVLSALFRAWLRRGGMVGIGSWSRALRRTALVAALSLFAVRVTVGLSTSDLWSTLLRGFDFSSGDAGLGRDLQFHALMRGWGTSPLVGRGLGAVAPGVIRSADQPWAYELSYVALLFAVGIIGVAIYAYGLAWILSRTRAIVVARGSDAPLLLSVLVGTIGFLVANATNPYLAKFDGLWPLFLPIAFINHSLLRRTNS